MSICPCAVAQWLVSRNIPLLTFFFIPPPERPRSISGKLGGVFVRMVFYTMLGSAVLIPTALMYPQVPGSCVYRSLCELVVLHFSADVVVYLLPITLGDLAHYFSGWYSKPKYV